MRLLRHFVLAAGLAVASAGAASAACYADYKAKRDDPLRLQYGVFEVRGACDRRSAAEELRPRLLADGWQLLEVVSVFDESGLEQRREDAGRFFLRY